MRLGQTLSYAELSWMILISFEEFFKDLTELIYDRSILVLKKGVEKGVYFEI